jgi:hypothetical protein
MNRQDAKYAKKRNEPQRTQRTQRKRNIESFCNEWAFMPGL